MGASDYVVYNLRQTYHEHGRYEFKVVMNPRRFKNCQDVMLKMLDPMGRELKCDVRRWGRKIVVGFDVDGSIPDGVVRVDLALPHGDAGTTHELLSFWVVQ